MTTFAPKQFVDAIKLDSLRVHSPSSVVFLCGGKIDEADPNPVVLRDAFQRAARINPPGFEIIRAEDATPLTSEAGYSDLFVFESDIAQIVGLILLFAESPGSLAELGAFAALQAVAPSLLAVILEEYYNDKSFIRDGPLRYLENVYGEEWISVLDGGEVTVDKNRKIQSINTPALMANVLSAVQRRLTNKPKWVKFDPGNGGHSILLCVGLCQEFGALTVSELREYVNKLGVSEPRLPNFLYCAQLLGWLKKVRKGHHIFYVAAPGDPALDYKLDVIPGARDKVRWRADIRAYWQSNDAARLRAIAQVIAPAGGVP